MPMLKAMPKEKIHCEVHIFVDCSPWSCCPEFPHLFLLAIEDHIVIVFEVLAGQSNSVHQELAFFFPQRLRVQVCWVLFRRNAINVEPLFPHWLLRPKKTGRQTLSFSRTQAEKKVGVLVEPNLKRIITFFQLPRPPKSPTRTAALVLSRSLPWTSL